MLAAVAQQHQSRLVVELVGLGEQHGCRPGRFRPCVTPAMSAIASSGRQPSISRSFNAAGTFGIGFGKRGRVFDGEARRLPSELCQMSDAAAVEACLRLAGAACAAVSA